MKKAALMAVVAGTVAGLGSMALGQTVINWKSPVDGNWSVAANWNPANMPDSIGEVGVIGGTLPYVVNMDVGTLKVGGIQITNALAELDILAPRTLQVKSFGVANEGTIVINPTANGNGAALELGKGATLGGTGTVTLNQYSSFPATAALTTSTGNTDQAIIDAGITINGNGGIFGTFVNKGTISGGVGGYGPVVNGVISQQEGGRFLVNIPGARASIGSGSVDGGRFDTANGGVLSTYPGLTGSISQVTINGLMYVEQNSSLRVTGDGLLTKNNGTILVNPTAGGNGASLELSKGSILGGSGTVALNQYSGFPSTAAITTSSGNTDLATIDAGLTINGNGGIYGTLTNKGTISGGIGGYGPVVNGVITQQDTGRFFVSVPGSRASIGSGTVVRGKFETANGGVISTYPGLTASVTQVVNNGTLYVEQNSALHIIAIGADVTTTNNGKIVVNPSAGGNGATLELGKGALLEGVGTVTLNQYSGFPSTAAITTSNGNIDPATIGSGITINGDGGIYGNITNNGTLAPGDPIGTVQVFGGLKQGPTGVIAIDLKSASERDSITGTGSIKLGGTLRATLLNFYQLPRGINNAYAFITLSGGGTVTGTFAKLDPYWLRVKYEPTRVLLYADCRGDFNADGFVTGDDYDAYVIAFFNGDPSADVDNDGFITGDDFDAFSDAFTAGC